MRAQFLLVLCAATVAAVTLPGERDWTNYNYEEYVKDFQKSSGELSSSANADRAAIFGANLVLINKHNADTTKTWFASVNEFTDWSNQEFRQQRAHGTSSHMSSLRDAPVHEEHAPAPASLDWRKQSGVVTAIKNQGGCGSCWAFSTAETLESAVALATNQTAPVLSPQQLVDCAPNPNKCGGTGGCSGATQEVGFEYVKGIGLTTEANYRYTEETGTCQTSKIKPVVQNSGFVKLPANNYTALINAVANIGPIAISVAAAAWQNYGGGVYTDSCGWEQDHAVQLVGYGTDSGQGYWIVRNSWGSGWGEDGYIRIARYGEGKEPCGMDNKPQDGSACAGDTKPEKLCGLCGILSDSSYPTGVKHVGPSPAPGPAPGPAPFPTGCLTAMKSICGSTKSSGAPGICRGCCAAHESDLQSAGCTPGDWDNWCEPTIVV